MFDLNDAMFMVGARVAINAMDFNCPVCDEPINYCPPDCIGFCSCGYNTEQDNQVDPRTEDDYYERIQDE